MKEGWDTKTLSEICTVDWGNTSLTKSAYIEVGGFLAVSAAGCDGRIGHKEHQRHTPVLSAIGAQCGRMFFPEEDFTAIKNTIALTPRKGACTERFLYLLLTHAELPKRGSAQPFISKGDVQSFKVPVPPLDEQQRIVALLDEAFEALATAIANAERNLQNARALFESHLESVFTKQDPEGKDHALGELIEIQNGFAFKSDEYTDSGYFVIRISNVQDGVITLGNPRFIKLTDKRLERFILNEGDILVSLTGNIGRVGVVQEDHLPAVLNQRVARITIRHHSIDRDFLYRFLMSRFFREKLQAAGHGAAQQNVSTQEIETVRLFLPSKDEQQQLANEFDNFAAETQHLTSIYERKLAALEELKTCLLHQAFNGEL